MKTACAVLAASLAACTAQAAFNEPAFTKPAGGNMGFQIEDDEPREVIDDARPAGISNPFDGKVLGSSKAAIEPGTRREILRLDMPDSESRMLTIVVGQKHYQLPIALPDDRADLELVTVGNVEAPAGVAPGIAPKSAYAIIEFGVGESSHKVVVDIVPAQVLNVPASFVKITVVNNQVGLVADSIDAYAQISTGATNRGTRAQRTVYMGVVPPIGGQAVVSPYTIAGPPARMHSLMPPFARSFKVYRAPFNVSLRVSFTDPSGQVLSDTEIPANAVPPEIEIPSLAAAIRLSNPGAVAVTQLYLVYFLSF